MKRCKQCRTEFEPARPLQQVCGLECAKLIAEKKRVKSESVVKKIQRKELKDAKERIKTLTDWKNEVQVHFNRYIRLRDGNKCITCGTENPKIQYAAGHYRTVKAASQHRYNEDNVNVQCNYACNSVKAGNIAAYRPALIAKIGLERVEALENDNSERRYTVEELKMLKSHYAQKIKELKSER